LTKVLYCVSPIGLGHASRAAAVGEILRRDGVEIEFVSGSAAAVFLASYGFKVHDGLRGPRPTEREGRMILPTLWYLRYWMHYRSNKRLIEKVVKEERPDLVVGDEEFSSISLALENGWRHVMITDELSLGFARSKLSLEVERRVMDWYRELQSRASVILVPDFGEDSGNVKHVTPIVRQPKRSREEVCSTLKIPSAGTLVCFSMSGSGLGRSFAGRAAEAFLKSGLVDGQMAFSGLESLKVSGRNLHPLGFVRDNHELIAVSDLVISSAGKSTIDEARNSGTPIIAIPFKDHFEQERNAAELGFSYEDVDRLEVLIQQHVGRRSPPKNYRGAEKAAKLIESA
jgi:UDP-N-acetylglucosamine--N-acetylmuramyl-(pentapeptide) pyrophosphoryl-undecaprenol N-acetylglucosamine transferase